MASKKKSGCLSGCFTCRNLLNQRKFPFLLEQRPCQPITQTQEDGNDGGVLSTCVHQILILVVAYQTLTVPSITP